MKGRGLRVKMNEKELFTLQFADDQVIITEIRELEEKREDLRT